MAKRSKLKNIDPFVRPLLDGTFDCCYTVIDDGKTTFCVTNIQGETAATVFIENKYCQSFVDRVHRWYKHQDYIIRAFPLEHSFSRKAAIAKLGEAVVRLQKMTLTRQNLAYYLDKYLIPMIEAGAPGSKSKFFPSTCAMIEDLQNLIVQINKESINLCSADNGK